MIITLTPDLEIALARHAERQGTTPELLALHDLHELYKEKQSEEAQTEEQFAGKTLADVLAGRIGVIRSSEHTGVPTSYLSESEGEGFADHLAEKRRHGRL